MLTWDSMPDNWNEVAPGTEISEEIFDDMLNAMPPIPLRKSLYCGFQVGEAHDHKEDAQRQVACAVFDVRGRGWQILLYRRSLWR